MSCCKTRSSASWMPLEARMRDMSRPSRGTWASALGLRDAVSLTVKALTHSDG